MRYIPSLPGLPLSQDSAIVRLLANNVTVGVGVRAPHEVYTTRFDIGWVNINKTCLAAGS
jgi:hypothetical protein